MKYKVVVYAALFLLLYSYSTVQAQKQANIWYFGDKAGIDFNVSPPVNLANSEMAQLEGSATICDKAGSLLFYTNGETVWNQNHVILENGTGLFGDQSSTQSALFVPQPGNDSIFYLFTSDAQENEGSKGLCYSVINKNKQEVVEKNVLLHTPTTEKVTAVRDDGCGIWVITHPLNSAQYYAYKVSTEGVNPVPVISAIGLPHLGNGGASPRGQLKVSSDGKKLACIRDLSSFEGTLELFDFDIRTGIVSNAQQLDIPPITGGILNLYGVEFSPDNTKLYATNETRLFQYDLANSLPKPVAVASLTDVSFWALQLAPDNKIYCAVTTSKAADILYVINQPDVSGTGCEVKEATVRFGGARVYLGLPNFIQSYFSPYRLSNDFEFLNSCAADSIAFSGTASETNISWQWDFGDPASGNKNTSALQNPVHTFSGPGIYTVSLRVINACGEASSAIKQVQLFADPVIKFDRDSIKVCFDQIPVKIDITEYPQTPISWAHGPTTASIELTKSGWYKVQNTNPCKTRTDSIYLDVTPQATAYLPDDTIVCEGRFALLDAKNSGATYLWNTGETSQTIAVDKPGKYWVEIQNPCSFAVDTATLVFINEDIGIYTTNVFTPNGDGYNDQFVNYVINAPDYLLQIVNRWGKVVYTTTDPFKHWDGLTGAQQAPAGVYFFYIRSQDCRAKPLHIRGTVTLLR